MTLATRHLNPEHTVGETASVLGPALFGLFQGGLEASLGTVGGIDPRLVLWALGMGPFDSGGVCSMGPCFEYGI